jgi:molybdopterin/thiamine biosynthesis adenylyltransferase
MNTSVFDRLFLAPDLRAAKQTLQRARILLIGSGGLGSEIALKLAGSSIGHVTIVDADRVSPHNIPHSPLFTPGSVGSFKVHAVSSSLRWKHPEMGITAIPKFIQQCENFPFADYDLIICAPDNNAVRWYINKQAVDYKVPALFLGVSGPNQQWSGYVQLYLPGLTACFLCISKQGSVIADSFYEEAGSTGDIDADRQRCGGENVAAPMLAPVVGTIATLASSMAVQIVGNINTPPSYVYIDLKSFHLQARQINAMPSCSVCGKVVDYPLVLE